MHRPVLSGVGELAFSLASGDPLCVTVTAHDLARGAALTGPGQCFGADVVDQLAPRPIDPPDSFTCELQQCEPKDDTWDLEKCTPGTAGGCSCAAPAHSTPLLALILLARRRRPAPRPRV